MNIGNLYSEVRHQESEFRRDLFLNEIAPVDLPSRGDHNHRLDDYVRDVVKGEVKKPQIINWFTRTPLKRFAERSTLTPLEGRSLSHLKLDPSDR